MSRTVFWNNSGDHDDQDEQDDLIIEPEPKIKNVIYGKRCFCKKMTEKCDKCKEFDIFAKKNTCQKCLSQILDCNQYNKKDLLCLPCWTKSHTCQECFKVSRTVKMPSRGDIFLCDDCHNKLFFCHECNNMSKRKLERTSDNFLMCLDCHRNHYCCICKGRLQIGDMSHDVCKYDKIKEMGYDIMFYMKTTYKIQK